MKTWYDAEEDVLNLQLLGKEYAKSVELANGIVFDIATDGSIMAIEILKASTVFREEDKGILESLAE